MSHLLVCSHSDSEVCGQHAASCCSRAVPQLSGGSCFCIAAAPLHCCCHAPLGVESWTQSVVACSNGSSSDLASASLDSQAGNCTVVMH